jgi:hypothetical protein
MEFLAEGAPNPALDGAMRQPVQPSKSNATVNYWLIRKISQTRAAIGN